MSVVYVYLSLSISVYISLYLCLSLSLHVSVGLSLWLCRTVLKVETQNLRALAGVEIYAYMHNCFIVSLSVCPSLPFWCVCYHMMDLYMCWYHMLVRGEAYFHLGDHDTAMKCVCLCCRRIHLSCICTVYYAVCAVYFLMVDFDRRNMR